VAVTDNRLPSILFVAPELAPWVKTGGLGEVAADLPRALRQAGADVRVLAPAYPALLRAFPGARELVRIDRPGGELPPVRLLEAPADVPLYLVDCEACYARPGGPYADPDGNDWPDNAIRFGLLGRIAALFGGPSSVIGWRPQVVHANDWPCGLAPAYLAAAEGPHAASIMTVHNLAYQGLYSRDLLLPLALAAESFVPQGLEFHGWLSFLKAGLQYATRISTVSPGYAREIQAPGLGFGLDGLLRHRASDLRGIVNGIDTTVWDPSTDPHLASRYDQDHLEAKQANKSALQRELGLREDDSRFLLGFVGRLVEQKGVDLVLEAGDTLVAEGMQLVLLGHGEPALEKACAGLQARHPGSVAVRIEFSERLAHRIEAGSDAFLMPSRFEPCGLNQLYSMRYGTPPVVHRTGGLGDTVLDGPREEASTGFLFDEPSAAALLEAVRRAAACWRHPPRWRTRQRAAMSRDSGWNAAARDYLALYGEAIAAQGGP